MSRIVVGYDGSAGARAAVDWARELALAAPGTEVHLINCYSLPAQIGELKTEYDRRQSEAIRASRVAELTATAAELAGVPVVTAPLLGSPIFELPIYAGRVGAGLLAVGSRGLNPAVRLVLGSVATAMVQRAPAPVLVARDRPLRRPGRILVGVDGSGASGRALRWAHAWAGGAEVVAVHVAAAVSALAYHLDQRGLPATVALDREAAGVVARAARVAGLLPDAVRVRAREGSAAEQLLKECVEGGYDLLVLGRRGLGGMGELVLGSVSDWLVRHAPVPVVVVK